MYRRMGLRATIAAISALLSLGTPREEINLTAGGYDNRHHGFNQSRRPPYKGHQPRRSKAQRRARAA